MTNEEIVQALRQCAQSDCSSCGMCPIFPDRECVEHLAAAAASLIERLTAENAALREKVPQWISVEERRPEPGKRVLATDGVFVGEAILARDSRWSGYGGGILRDCIGSVVTYWMPLPEAPGEVE